VFVNVVTSAFDLNLPAQHDSGIDLNLDLAPSHKRGAQPEDEIGKCVLYSLFLACGRILDKAYFCSMTMPMLFL
jgi:hypothetical protein